VGGNLVVRRLGTLQLSLKHRSASFNCLVGASKDVL
jgi:hypothetical protein